MSGGITGAANVVRSAWDFLYQVSPIFLTGGIVSAMPGGVLPFAALGPVVAATVAGVATPGAESFFGRFEVIPGGTIINQSVATYPFANQQVAANATIQEPLTISLQLKAPVQSGFGYLLKSAIFPALQYSLATHNNSGGLYTVMTPAVPYFDCILTAVTDVTDGESKQTQIMWQFDFFKPLISQSAATSALNSLMSKLSGGTPILGAPSWLPVAF